MLRKEIEQFAAEHNFSAGLVLSAVGALKSAKLRMAGATKESKTIVDFEGDYEIVSIQGTIAKDDCHIHISVSDKSGKVVGGHLKEGIVGVTAEVSLLELPDKKFLREPDPETGFKELVIK